MLLLAALNTTAQAQANDWIIPPRTVISFGGSGASVSLLSSSSSLASCSSTSADDKYSWTLSDGAGNGVAFVKHCGVYNMTGSAIGSGTGTEYQNIFSVPGLCNTYYAIQWENVTTTHSNKLTLRTLSIGASVTETASTDLIAPGIMHGGVAVAAAPLEHYGHRKVYVSSDLDLICYEFDGTGTLVSTTNIATLPYQVDQRTGMEVSPDGTKLLLSTGTTLYMYDITAGTFTTIGTFAYNVTIAGFEYVPLASGDRIYFSYHFFDGYNTLNGLDYVTTSAPTTNVDAIPGVTGSAKYAYGYTDIERGNDGLLYFAYHNNYSSHIITAGDVGTLVSMSTSVSSPSIVYDGAGSAVQVKSLTTFGYIIQKQIDGEDYGSLYGPTWAPTIGFKHSVTAPWSPVPNIYFSSDTLMMDLTFHGPHEQYTLTVETGSVSFPGGVLTFTPDAVQPSSVYYNDYHYSGKMHINLADYTWSSCGAWLSHYRGPIRVTVDEQHTVCSNSLGKHFITSEVYNLIDPLFFLMNSPKDQAPTHSNPTGNAVCNSSPYNDACTGTTLMAGIDGAQDRNPVFAVANDCGPRFGVFGTNPSHDNLIMDNTQKPSCEMGWQGATTTGLYYSPVPNFNNPYGINFGSILSYDIKVEEFDQPVPGAALTNGTIILNDLGITSNLSTGGIPFGGYLFNVTTFNYFISQYASIAGNRSDKVYQVTYTQHATGGDCDEASAVSFFRIMDDGTVPVTPLGGVNWRVATPVSDVFKAYPNPASSVLHLQWSNEDLPGIAQVRLVNLTGKTVLSQDVADARGNNDHSFDIAKLAPGMYFFQYLQVSASTMVAL